MGQLQPGDLVFYEGEYYSETAKRQLHDMVHGAPCTHRPKRVYRP
jgi:hypothetical protein